MKVEHFQQRKLHSLSEQPVAVLSQPYTKEVFTHTQMELPVFLFVPIAPCQVTGHHWEKSGLILLTATLRVFVCVSKILSQSFLPQAQEAEFPQPFLITELLQSPHHLCSLCWTFPSSSLFALSWGARPGAGAVDVAPLG